MNLPGLQALRQADQQIRRRAGSQEGHYGR